MRVPRWRRAFDGVGANVIALGAVSLVTDVSSEMVTAVLPLYLVFQVGLSTVAFGFLDGTYIGVTALVRLVGGHAADRWQRRKLVAGLGYGLSAACKPLLLVAGGSVPALGAVLAADRTGKGLRTAPRDALISLSAAPQAQGRAFGVHRGMDTVGALLGPVVAGALLLATHRAYDAVFVVSFCVATLAVLLLVTLVRDRRGPRPPRPAVSLRAGAGLLRDRSFRRLFFAVVLLGAATVSDSFIYLLLQHRFGLALEVLPFLPVGTAATYLLLSVPVGLLADRSGRWGVFLAGHLALLGAYGALLIPWGGTLALLFVTLGLHGVFYAASDGVLMACAGPLVPEHLRTSGMALVQTGQAVARMVPSMVLGALWAAYGQHTAMAWAVGALVIALFGALSLRPARSVR